MKRGEPVMFRAKCIDSSHAAEENYLKIIEGYALDQCVLGGTVFETKIKVDGGWLEVDRNTLEIINSGN